MEKGAMPPFFVSVSGFKLQSDFEPTGDQPEAIRQLVEGVESGVRNQTLLG